MTDPYVPLTGPPTWHHAACRGENPDMWFPFNATSTLAVNRRGETAVDICRRCRERGTCLAWADANPKLTEHGIWGALTPEERNPARAQRLRQADVERKRRQRRLDDAITGWS